MKKLFLAVSSMIVTGFLIKSYRKLREKPEPELDELHRRMRSAYAKVRRRAAERTTFAKLDAIYTPRDGEGWMASIDTVQQMRDALRPKRAVDVCDAMAIAPGSFS